MTIVNHSVKMIVLVPALYSEVEVLVEAIIVTRPPKQMWNQYEHLVTGFIGGKRNLLRHRRLRHRRHPPSPG